MGGFEFLGVFMSGVLIALAAATPGWTWRHLVGWIVAGILFVTSLRRTRRWSAGEPASPLFDCRAELDELHALAREAAVSYSLHYSETEDAWYVTVDSAAPAECYVTKTRTLPIALFMALEHLRKLVSHG